MDRRCVRFKEELMNLPFLSFYYVQQLGQPWIWITVPSQIEHLSKKIRIALRFETDVTCCGNCSKTGEVLGEICPLGSCNNHDRSFSTSNVSEHCGCCRPTGAIWSYLLGIRLIAALKGSGVKMLGCSVTCRSSGA